MLWKVALFEFRYQLRQPAFWVIFGIFFLLSFGAMSSENITIGGGGAENFNSPYRVMHDPAGHEYFRYLHRHGICLQHCIA